MIDLSKIDPKLQSAFDRDERGWAERLAGLMSKEEFSAFAEFIDGCDIDFSGALAEIDEKNFPEKYGDVEPNKVPV